MAEGRGELLKSVHFEVFGEVQGVYFRKVCLRSRKKTPSHPHILTQFTRNTAVGHNLVGWVQNNTRRGTVVGVAQGAESQVELM